MLQKICDVSVHAVRSWYYGTRQPTVKQAKKIMLVTNQALTWEDIYGPIEEEGDCMKLSIEALVKFKDLNSSMEWIIKRISH